MGQTFELGRGHTFVSGLFWLPLPGTLRDYKKETENLARETNCDLAVWRTSSALQVGLGSTEKGLTPGLLSAAAVISKSLEIEPGAKEYKDFLCATEVPGGAWLYVAQREGVIMPDGDFLGTEDEVRSRMLSDYSVSQWNVIIAPAHWGMKDSKERRFEEFLPQKAGKTDYKRWWGLAPVKRDVIKTMTPIIIIAVALLAGLIGYQKWQANKAAEELARLAAEQQGTVAGKPVVHPWKQIPRAKQFVGECMGALTRVKTLWPGNWLPRDVTCSGAQFVVVWLRQPHGWIDHLLAVEPKAVISVDGGMASLSIPLTLDIGDDEATPQENARIVQMLSAGQRYGFKITISAPPAPPALPGDKDKAPALITWKELAWKVEETSMSSLSVAAILDGPGFRVGRIRGALKGGVITWVMEGTQYVQQ
jgi:hypothetical protein